MKIGIQYFPTDYSMRAVPVARALEERGFDSLWVVEHTHIPLSRRTPHPLFPELPDYYLKTYEPFTFLAQASAVTEKLLLATGVCLVPAHHPVTLARRVASLDSLSDGRFLFGVGAGWNAEELEDHGVDFKQRWKVLKESVLAMKECWTKEQPEYHGQFIHFDPAWVEPKPVRKPHPPVYIGAASRFSVERVADYGNGWVPHYTPEFDQLLKDLNGHCERRGRDIKEIDVCVVIETIASKDHLAELKDKGVNRVILYLPTVSQDEALKVLDAYAPIVEWAREIH